MLGAVQPRDRRELLSALERGAPVEPGDDAVSIALVAVDHARRGRLGSASSAVDRAPASGELHSGSSTGAVKIACAVVLYACRRYSEALALLDTVEGPLRREALARAISLSGRLEWTHELGERLRTAAELDPTSARHPLELLRLARKGRDDAGALGWADRAIELAPNAPSAHMERANVLLSLGRFDEMPAAIDRAIAAEPVSFVLRLEAARLFGAIGLLDQARVEYERARAIDPSRSEPAEGLAIVALRAGELERARDLGASAMVLGAIDVIERRYEEAMERLTDARTAEALAWRVEAAMRLGRYEDAHRDLDRAMAAAEGFFWVGWVLRLLTVLYAEPSSRPGPAPLAEIRRAALELLPGETAFPEDHDPLAAFLERALAQIGANRSGDLLRRDGDRFVRLRGLSGPRFESRRLLESIRARPPAHALAGLGEVIARYPESSLPICHRGELRLWLGDYEGARADLEGAIAQNPFTRWAYIGLTTLETLEGRPERALETCALGIHKMNDTTGPAVYVARGEALLALGRVEEARVDLDRAVELHGSRASAVILRAILEGERGDASAFDRLWERLLVQAPALLSDAAGGVSLVRDPGAAPIPTGDRTAVLRRALAMMRGNRSSTCISYFANGSMRFVTHYPHRGDLPHAREREELARAFWLLTRVP
jgi:tetratricopeptide (TPR) repeat protein